MRTKDYITKFKLDDERFANHFNTELFIKDLGQEFQDKINYTIEVRKKAGLEFDYRIFQVLIQEMQQKFCAISNKKAGGPLRKELWNAFYAKVIINARATYFPVEHTELQAKRAKFQEEKRKREIRDSILSGMGPVYYVLKEERGPEYRALLKEIDQEVEKRYLAEIKGD